ncbi:uncharacterized protein LOC114531923 [Dendronephthya gigantea]|uniref:uncharacterized protein LOC114531923 n=1 Tax=Dendronephthya gigantea TaxID=151771 RepID=UPI00106AC53F|nr:uncharacterized protein LOC114531923 [Dendronephthya gigantea]
MWQQKYKRSIAISALVWLLRTTIINAGIAIDDMSVDITIDNSGRLITDTGKNCSVNNDWQTPQQFTLPGDTRSVLIKAHNDPGNVGGILASFNNNVVTNDSWECADMKDCGFSCDIRSSYYAWKPAVRYGRNDDTRTPWHIGNGGKIKHIKSNAQWIWVENSRAKDVWCRKTFAPPSTSPPRTQTSANVKVFLAALRSSSQHPKQTSQHDTATSSLSHLPTSTTSHGKATSSLSHLPTSTTSHGKATSSLSHLPTSTTSHGKATSSLSHLPTSTTSHGKATSSLSHLATSTVSYGKATSSLSHLLTSTTSNGKASVASSSQAACVGMSTTRVENHKLEGFVFKEFHVKHVAQCGMKCFNEKDCRSFNFISSSLSCELFDFIERLGSENFKPAPGVTYFYRND